MNIRYLNSILAVAAAAFATLATTGSAHATSGVGGELDAHCARQPAGTAVPQQSRPYRASGNSCALCHPNGNTSQFNTLGTATRNCTSTSCPTSVNTSCVNAAPGGTPSISAPAAGASVTAGTAVIFTGTGGSDPDGFALSYHWTFSNGLPAATGASVSITPATAGTVTATLEVRDANGSAIATRPTRSITVTAPNQTPNGSITAPTGIVQNQAVSFAGSGTDPDGNTPLSYAWSFGANAIPATSTAQNPSVSFSTTGSRTVTLTVTDSRGLADPTPASVSVTVAAPPVTNQPPDGSIVAPASIVQGTAITFQGSASDPNGDTVSYAWNFGAGATPATSTAQNPAVTFNTAGTRTVTLTVTDSRGLADPTPASVSVTVAAPPPVNNPPTGAITAPAGIIQGQAVTFQGSGTDPDGDAVTYAWSFGPNASPATSTAQNPSVTFSTTGTQNVSLVVTDSQGLADPTPATATVTVAAAPPPPPPANACVDADRDGYSATGGACGPVDCNDNNAAVNPGATEACGDGVDNDCDGARDSADKECNGTDCLARFFAKSVVITSASWDRGDRELDVRGNQADAGAAVTVLNADSGALIGTATVRSTGSWRFEDDDIRTAPCRVRVEINGQSAERSVSNAPSTCGGGTGAAPVANGDSYSVVSGTTLSVPAPGVLGNDTAAAGRTLTAAVASNPASGSLSLASNGGFTYTPAAGFSGTVSFTYRANDGSSASAPATVTITVTQPNRAPNGTIGAPAAITLGQPASFQGGATDPDGDTVTYAWNFGANATPATSSAQNPSVTFSTAGTRSVTLAVTDSKGLSDPSPASVQVTVTSANRPPEGTILSPSRNITVERGDSVSFRAIGSDPDGNTPLTYNWDFGGGATNSSLQNTRVRFSRNGTFTVRLTVTDSAGLSDPTPAVLTVRVVEDD